MSAELDTIGVTRLEGKVARFIQFPTKQDRRLIVELRRGGRRVVQCEKCGKTDSLEARPDSPRFANYLILCRNDSTRLFLTTAKDSKGGQQRNEISSGNRQKQE